MKCPHTKEPRIKIDFRKWESVLTAITSDVKFALDIHRKRGFTYAFISDAITQFESFGWLTKERRGRVVFLELTLEGDRIRKLCQELKRSVYTARYRREKQCTKKNN